MSGNNQQLTCGNVACRQKLETNNNYCLQDCTNGGTAERNTLFRVTYRRL